MIVNDILDFSKVEEGNLNCKAARFLSPRWFTNATHDHPSPCGKKSILLKWTINRRTPEWLVGETRGLDRYCSTSSTTPLNSTADGSVAVDRRSEVVT